MPWVKGQSGNPGGATPRRNALARAIRDGTKKGQELVDFAVEVLRGNHGAELADRMDAMKWLADRGWGKAVETIVLEDERSPDETQPQAIATDTLSAGLGPAGVIQ